MNLSEIFQEFIEVVKKNANSNIIIALFDPNGQLINSSEKNTADTLSELEKKNKTAIIYRIQILDKFYGFLIIDGKQPDKYFKDVGELIFETFKTKISLENEKQQRNSILSTSDKLVESIIYGKNIQNTFKYMEDLFLSTNEYRIPVLMSCKNPLPKNFYMNLRYRLTDNQTFYSRIQTDEILVFFHIDHSHFEDYQTFVTDCLNSIYAWSGIEDLTFYVGLIEHDIRKYFKNYQKILWLKDNVSSSKPILFFENSYLLYLLSKDNDSFMLFEPMIERIKYNKYELEDIIQTLEALQESDFNISQAARKLFVHKNTLIYRIGKFEKNIFGFNIRDNAENRFLVMAFLDYVKLYK